MRMGLMVAATMLAGSAQAAPTPEQVAQRMLDTMKETSGVPGFGAAVWKDGKVIWSGSTGHRDVERDLRVTADTKFRLASVSKVIASTAAAKLAEEGKIDLDAPVAARVPEVGTAWPAINARQLAAHISGIPHYQEQDAGRGDARFGSSREAVKIFAGRPLLTAPGETYRYSSWGYSVLGALVEVGSGRHFVDYVTREVTPGLAIGPDFTDGPDVGATIAYEFGSDGKGQRAARHDYSYTWAGGGLGATPSAIATFGGLVLDGKVVRPTTREMMFTPMTKNSGEAVTEDDYQVGFGWRVAKDRDGRRMAFHNGVTIGARSALVLFRDERMSASLLSNALWTSSIDQSAQMLAAPFRGPPAGLIATDCPATAKRYSGTFGAEAVSGTASFVIVDGLCTGTLENAGALTKYFGSGPQPGTAPIKIIGLASDGSLPRGGLVTPYGIYDLRAAGPNRFVTKLGSTRTLDIVLND